jgi:hypothetical protein
MGNNLNVILYDNIMNEIIVTLMGCTLYIGLHFIVLGIIFIINLKCWSTISKTENNLNVI